jgi:hypothetical protein
MFSSGQAAKLSGGAITLDTATKFDLVNADMKWVEYRGRHALKLVPLSGHEHAQNEELMAVLADSDFRDGAIELDVAGARRQGYSIAEDERGFKGMIGVSFAFGTRKVNHLRSTRKCPPRQSVVPQPIYAIRIHSRFPLEPAARGNPRDVRVLC